MEVVVEAVGMNEIEKVCLWVAIVGDQGQGAGWAEAKARGEKTERSLQSGKESNITEPGRLESFQMLFVFLMLCLLLAAHFLSGSGEYENELSFRTTQWQTVREGVPEPHGRKENLA